MILEEKNENNLISKQQNPLLSAAKANDDINVCKEQVIEEEMQLEKKNPQKNETILETSKIFLRNQKKSLTQNHNIFFLFFLKCSRQFCSCREYTSKQTRNSQGYLGNIQDGSNQAHLKWKQRTMCEKNYD